jgi:hypothetical protein
MCWGLQQDLPFIDPWSAPSEPADKKSRQPKSAKDARERAQRDRGGVVVPE